MGGIEAIPASWPSIAYIVWSYRADFVAQLDTPTAYGTSVMAGTLIDTRRILTIAGIIPASIQVTFKNVSYTINVVLNSYYPTLASMFKVYLGVQNVSTLTSPYPVYAKSVVVKDVLNFLEVNFKILYEVFFYSIFFEKI